MERNNAPAFSPKRRRTDGLAELLRKNQGCTYELKQLLNIIPLDRVILLIDDMTDRLFLERTIARLWQEVDSLSPNISKQEAVVRLFNETGQDPAEDRKLLGLLFKQTSYKESVKLAL